jgi:hypothetical protein
VTATVANAVRIEYFAFEGEYSILVAVDFVKY